jgi:hypothetical protein
VHDILAAAVERLDAGGARDEFLVELIQPRWLGVKLGARLDTVDRVWRLGVVLLSRSGALYATGTTLRVTEPRHPNAQSRLAEDRREIRALALKSGIPGGETINLDALDIQLDALTETSRPVARRDGELFVAWAPGSDLTPLGPYLDERVALLVDPPEGA